MKLSTKLYAAFAGCIAAMLVVALIGLFSLRSVAASGKEIAENWLPSVEGLLQMQTQILDHRRYELNHVMTRDPATMSQRDTRIRATREKFAKSGARYEKLIVVEEERRLFTQLRAQTERYFAESDRILALSTAMKKDEALAASSGPVVGMVGEATETLEKLVEINVKGADEAIATSATVVTRSWATLIGISIAAALAAFGMAFVIVRGVQRQLGGDPVEVKAVAERVGSGDLDTPIALARGDRDSVLAVMSGMQDRIQSVLAAQNALAAAHEKGDTDHRMAADALPGAYRKLAENVNGLVEAQLAVQNRLLDVVQQYAKGDFSADMPDLPGRKARITEAARAVKAALVGISGEIDTLVAAAGRGEFKVRGEDGRYTAKFRDMVSGLNRLMAECERGLDEANAMYASLAKGDLTYRIDGEFSGMFAEMQENANRTAESLAGLMGRIGESSRAIGTATEEIARGNADLSSRTEEQASSLEETASSMEQFTSTVKQNAESAKQANSLAVNAAVKNVGVDEYCLCCI